MSGYEYEGYEDLADRLERLEQATEQLQYDTSDDEYLPHEISAETQQDGWSAREHLMAIADETRQRVFAEAQAHPQPPMTDSEIMAEAQRISSPAVDWSRDEEGIRAYVQEHDLDLAPVLATRDPQTLAKSLMLIKGQMTLAELNRQTKQAAQTMSGTNSARESETEWDRIASAKGVPRVRF